MTLYITDSISQHPRNQHFNDATSVCVKLKKGINMINEIKYTANVMIAFVYFVFQFKVWTYGIDTARMWRQNLL